MAQPTETIQPLYIQDLKEKPRDIVWFARAYYNDRAHTDLDSTVYWVQDRRTYYDIAHISTNIINGKEVVESAKYKHQEVVVPSGSSVDDMKRIIETFIKADIKGEAS